MNIRYIDHIDYIDPRVLEGDHIGVDPAPAGDEGHIGMLYGGKFISAPTRTGKTLVMAFADVDRAIRQTTGAFTGLACAAEAVSRMGGRIIKIIRLNLSGHPRKMKRARNIQQAKLRRANKFKGK